MTKDLRHPAEGTPPIDKEPQEFADAARKLRAGRGPFAIDTERASSFRYDDRAFLVQVRRRDSGTILLAPEGRREEFTALLGPVLNNQDWIIHAAPSDLPSLTALGLYPGTLFDTELAGRLAGFDRVNLGAMIEKAFDLHLEKRHSAEDWSTDDLPQDWIDYAALDVELLIELAEYLTLVLDEQGKLDWASEEFEYIRQHFYGQGLAHRSWRDLKGLGKMRNRDQLAIVEKLWEAREHVARKTDTSPHRLLPDRAILSYAARPPEKITELRRVPRLKKAHFAHQEEWFEAIQQGLATSPEEQPEVISTAPEHPPRQSWPKRHPAAASALTKVSTQIGELSQDVNIPAENILRGKEMRAIVWSVVGLNQASNQRELAELLKQRGLRDWQIGLIVPRIGPVFFPSS